MQIEVLRYIHQDYEVIVRTQDINYSWEKFKGRINYTRKGNPEIDAPFILTNREGMNGASAMFYPGVMEKINILAM